LELTQRLDRKAELAKDDPVASDEIFVEAGSVYAVCERLRSGCGIFGRDWIGPRAENLSRSRAPLSRQGARTSP